jgi:divalent metal cation (Fe/Co/Zn/Cd) transporter
MAGGGDSKRAIMFALGANFSLAVAKGMATFFTGSSAMLAETVHSLADCGIGDAKPAPGRGPVLAT